MAGALCRSVFSPRELWGLRMSRRSVMDPDTLSLEKELRILLLTAPRGVLLRFCFCFQSKNRLLITVPALVGSFVVVVVVVVVVVTVYLICIIWHSLGANFNLAHEQLSQSKR